jgi:hypothetical protein
MACCGKGAGLTCAGGFFEGLLSLRGLCFKRLSAFATQLPAEIILSRTVEPTAY